MGFGEMDKSGSRGPASEPVEKDIKRRVVEYKREEITQSPDTGFTLGFCGFPNTGKTMTALTLANLQKELIPLWGDKYPITAKALENGDVPEIRSIWVIDSENAAKKQFGRERKLLKYVNGTIPLTVVTIPEVAIEYDVDSKGTEVKMDQVSIDEVFDAVWTYNQAIDDFNTETDGHGLLIVDSCSRFKKLVDMKTRIVWNLSVAEKGEEYVKQAGFNKWGDRNSMWEKTMTKLRGTPGLVVGTFKTKENKEWVMKMLRKKGGQPSATTTVMLDGTAHNFDMMYDFEFATDRFDINVSTRVGRYVNRTVDEQNHFEIDTKYRFSSLQIMEHLLKEVMADDFHD